MHVFRALIAIALATALMGCGQGQPGPKGDPGPARPAGRERRSRSAWPAVRRSDGSIELRRDQLHGAMR